MWFELLLVFLIAGFLINLPVIIDSLWNKIRHPQDLLKLGIITGFLSHQVKEKEENPQKSMISNTTILR